MPYLIENGDGTRVELPMFLKRKYAKAKRQFELGLWGQNFDCIKAVTLTTWDKSIMLRGDSRGESRNSWKHIVLDNRHLRERLHKLGLVYEDSFCCEISPKSHLLHLHGFMRFDQPIDGGYLHEILSENWGDIHGSPVVWVKDIFDTKKAIDYDVKHALKNYVSEGFHSMRILRSKSWLPPGWKKAQKAIVRWALSKRDWDIADEETVVPEAFEREYVPDKWGVANDFLRKWCEGEAIELDLDDRRIYICKNEYFEAIIEAE
jgi:hypothetical protein